MVAHDDQTLAEMRAINEQLLVAGLRAQEVADQLRHQLAFTSAVTDNLGDGVCALNRDGRVTFVNPAAQQVLGWTEADLLGRELQTVVRWQRASGDRSPAGQVDLLAPLHSGRTVRADDAQLTCRDGTVVPVAFSSAPVVVDGHIAGVVVAFRDSSERRRLEDEQHFLAEASRVLTTSLDHATTLASLARLAVPRLADWCAVSMAAEDGPVHWPVVVHRDPATAPLLRAVLADCPPDPAALGNTPPMVLRAQGAGVPAPAGGPLHPAAHDGGCLTRLRAIGCRSVMIVPLVARGRTLGTLWFGTSAARRARVAADLALAEELARRAALAVDNARLYQEAQRALAREQVARAAAERLAAERAAILSHIADGVIIADPAGAITFVNEAAERLAGSVEPGATDAGAPVAPHLLTMDGHPYPPAETPLTRALVGDAIIARTDVRIQRPDGAEVVARASATSVVGDDGRRLGAVLLLHDVTAQHQLERQKDEFFANVSHDLRTPVAVIKASIGVVLANEPAAMPAPLHRLLVNIDLATDRVTTLISDLLDLTRLQAKRLQLRPAAGDLRTLVRRAARAIEPLAQTRGQHVIVDLPPQPVPGRVDTERLEQALLNLLGNAHQYGRAGGLIRLRLVPGADETRIAVIDDGPGIPAAEQAHIFERFYRAEPAAVQSTRGSGLGLAIARALIELHGGRLWVESRPGAGATFWIALPAGSPAPVLAEEEVG